MSRLFGSSRVTSSPMNSSQAAEADSSNEVPKVVALWDTSETVLLEFVMILLALIYRH